MIVCVCRRVSDRDIAHHAGGCAVFEELQIETGVATGCGRCRECAQALFHEHAGQSGTCGLHVDAKAEVRLMAA